MVLLDKRSGGLGVKNLGSLNKALPFKWSWHFAIVRGALLNEVTRGKYREQEGGWCFVEGLWREGGMFGVMA